MYDYEDRVRGGDDARAVALIALIGLLFSAAVYLPDLGRGFIKDDFVWILQNREGFNHLHRFLPTSPGFYRPLVSLSFAADFLFHGLNSRGYGFTNLALFLLCICAVVYLCRSRSVGLSWRATALASFVWALNPHGINMALLWISGRTALCLTLFAVLAIATFVRRQYVWAAVCLGAALASKEEAVLLPVIMWTWHRLVVRDEHVENHDDGLAQMAALSIPLAVYLALRGRTLPLTITSAPPFYQFTFLPTVVIGNALEYLDRGATASIVVVLLAWLVYRTGPVLRSRDLRLLTACTMWFGVGYAITLFLPVRSSLYAVFPSVGSAIACALLVQRICEAAQERTPAVRLEAVLATVLLFVPIQRSRDARWVEPARLSHRALRTIAAHLQPDRHGDVIVLQDNPDPLSNFSGAFGTLGSEALYVWTGLTFEVSIRPTLAMPDREVETDQKGIAAVFRVTHGLVEPVRLPE